MPHDDTSKTKENKEKSATSLSTAAAIKLETAAVERYVSTSYFILSSLMCRSWGIRHQPQGSITLGNFTGRGVRGAVVLGSLMITITRACFRIPQIVRKVFRIFLSCRARRLAQDGGAEVGRWPLARAAYGAARSAACVLVYCAWARDNTWCFRRIWWGWIWWAMNNPSGH